MNVEEEGGEQKEEEEEQEEEGKLNVRFSFCQLLLTRIFCSTKTDEHHPITIDSFFSGRRTLWGKEESSPERRLS